MTKYVQREIVELPKEVVESLDYMLKECRYPAHQLIEDVVSDAISSTPALDDYYDTDAYCRAKLVRAIIVGYRVERTWEEIIVDRYLSYIDNEQFATAGTIADLMHELGIDFEEKGN